MASIFKEKAPEIFEFVREMKQVTGKDIADYFNISPATAQRAMTYLQSFHPELKSARRKGYYIDESAVPIKNAEGYPDPTAARAINGLSLHNLAYSMMNNGVKEEPNQLETFTVDTGCTVRVDYAANTNLYVVLSTYGPHIQCLGLFESKKPDNMDYVLETGCGWVNCRQVYSWDMRKYKVSNCPDIKLSPQEYEGVRSLFARFMGLHYEGGSLCSMEMELLKQRAEIYQDAFYSVCGRIGEK